MIVFKVEKKRKNINRKRINSKDRYIYTTVGDCIIFPASPLVRTHATQL